MMKFLGQKKFFDITLGSATATNNTWRFKPLIEGIVGGHSMVERIGNRIQIKKLHITGHLQVVAPTLMVDSEFWVKIMVVLDTQNNSTDNGTDMQAAGGLFTSNDWYGLHNLYRVGRYRVIHESIYNLKTNVIVDTAGTGYTGGTTSVPVDINLPMNTIIEYNDDASGDAEQMPSNCLYWGIIYLGGAGASTTPKYTLTNRVRWRDLQ